MNGTHQSFLDEFKKFKNPLGFLILLLISVSFAFMLKGSGVKAGVVVMLILIGPIAAFSIVAYPKVGIVILLGASYFINLMLRMDFTSFPLGTVMDGLEALLILGVIIKQKYEPDWKFLRSPISILIIIWISYNFLQIANPGAESRMAWIYTIRSLAIVMLTYFIFVIHIRSVTFIRFLIKMWLFLNILAGLYALKQQYIGFFGFEEAYLYSDPIIMDLLFINGQWRKFSFLADPVVFSYSMVIASLLCLSLQFAPIKIWKKIILLLLIPFFLMCMLSAGTRSAYILIPASITMLLILKFNKKILLITAMFGMAFFVLVMIPTGNPALYRFQSAFKPSNDASFNVRAINQKFIQPYIQSHPMGGGLGSTGVWGAKFSPYSFLAAFPPDSGYVRVAVETGWVGLLIFCALMFVILKTGIENYYRIRDPELKSYCLAMILIVFAVNIGNYPQEAINQFPASIYFYLTIALINITYELDQKKNIAAGKLEEENKT